jgi:hypothetical protein
MRGGAWCALAIGHAHLGPGVPYATVASATQMNDFPCPDTPEGLEHRQYQVSKIVKAVASRAKHDYRRLEAWDFLPEDKVSVNGDKDVEFTLHEIEQPAVGDSGPAHFWHGSDLVASDRFGQRARKAFVEEDFHSDLS